ncbi:TPA: hypothetical protein N0F65_000052, partial [Lagenidium giganteum]
IFQKKCPHIQIRSPRDHVCDICMINANKMKSSGHDNKYGQVSSDKPALMEWQMNYVYSEQFGGKGPNEVIRLLASYLDDMGMLEVSPRVLTINADNCGGQNKNDFVVKMMVLLAHVGYFKETNIKFFIRGRTKNACDRCFGHLKRKLLRSDCWTMQQLCEMLKAA